MQNKYKKEIWKDIVFPDNIRKDQNFKVSNFGRIRSFNILKKGRILKQGKINGYKSIAVKQKNNKYTTKYVHRLVAKAFLEKKEDETLVIHLDYKKRNNKVENLKWVNKEDANKHLRKNKRTNPKNAKLTLAKVKEIKKIVADPNRTKTFKEIAKKFKISDMQLYRIRTGENWSYVSID